MTEYRVVDYKWIEVAEGYGHWEYTFEKVEEK